MTLLSVTAVREIIHLKTAISEYNLILDQQVAVLLVDFAVRRCLDLPRAVIKLQDRHRTALCFDQSDIHNQPSDPLLTSGG